MGKSAARAGLEFEAEVRGFFKRIGLNHVDGGPSFKVAGYQVDACGGWDDVLLIAESAQAGTATEQASIHTLISELRGKQSAIRKSIRQLDKYQNYARFEFLIISRNIPYTMEDRQIASQKPRIHLIDFRMLEYYERLTSLIGKRAALFNFLGELAVEQREFNVPRLPAFRVRMPQDSNAYLFWCEPYELLKVAYVARRESGRERYYQRILSGDRLRQIGDFINDGGVFPNNVIICFDKRPEFRAKEGYGDSYPSWIEFGELIFPRSYRSCWVIDGQHRLYAFARLPPNPKAQKLAVFAFESLPEQKQAKYFIDINHEQKPVSPDLIWDLEGEMRPETDRGLIANCVKELNSRVPLKGKIFVPFGGECKRGQLKMSGLCQDLQDTRLCYERTRTMVSSQRNPLVYGSDRKNVPNRVASALANFLELMRVNCREDVWNGIVLRPGGITIALNVYEQILTRLGKPSEDEVRKYAITLATVLADMAPTAEGIRRMRRELTSYAQRREALRQILSGMQEELGDQDFGKAVLVASDRLDERVKKLERRLAKSVAEVLGISEIAQLKQLAPEKVWRDAQRITDKEHIHYPKFAVHEALSLGDIKQIMEQRNNRTILMPHFVVPESGFNSFEEVIAALEHVIRARVRAHGRLRGNVELVNTYINTFERLLAS